MHLSLKWLREFVPYEGTPEALGDALTMLGLEIEEIIYPFKEIEEVVIGHVVECERHPEADKLSVCTVNVGEAENLTIVCGAPNVGKGQNVPVAKVGCTLPGDFKIKKAKLRGVPSTGMICSERELGLGDEHDGIMVLPGDFTPGANFVKAMNLDEIVLDVAITPNRADALSVIGLAREVALAFDLPLTLPAARVEETGEDCSVNVAIEIADADQCYLYMGRCIDGITVGKSPDWMRWRLHAVGLRPISNTVDVTNYVLMECGHPLHAFDRDLLEHSKIVVDVAEEGESFTTLDEQDRSMKQTDLMIKDGAKSVAIAGVMGGANSEINSESTNVFLECAVFRPGSVRRTARRLALSTDASYRFERGVDQQNAEYAMNRAAQLIAELSGGSLRPGVCKKEPTPWVAPELTFRPQRAYDLLGINLGDDFCKKTLEKLGCTINVSDATVWKITPPSHRLDYEREADLIEEVGRVYGMDNIEPVLPTVHRTLEHRDLRRNEFEFWAHLKYWGIGLGLNEAINYSFVGQKDLDHLNLPKEPRIPIMNPLTSEQDVLRTELAPGLLQNLRHNLAQGNTGLRLFELAHIFEADAESDTKAREYGRMNILMYGGRFDTAWPHKEEDVDYTDLKGVVEHLFTHLEQPVADFTLEDSHNWLSPCVGITLNGEKVGVMGRVKPKIADAYHAKKDVWMADLDTDVLMELYAQATLKFQKLPVYPPSRRDMTVQAPATLKIQDVVAHVKTIKLPLLESIELIDIYEPEKTKSGEAERNLTFRLTFRSPKKTLKDKEVDKETGKVAKSLQQALPVRI